MRSPLISWISWPIPSLHVAKNISVVIEKCVDGPLLILDIKDDGIGMDNEMAMKVQDPFFSTKTGRKVGLGIPLLKGTAETTGGTFCLTSEPGRGTEIRVTFNADHPDLPPLGESEGYDPGADGGQSGSKFFVQVQE